MVSIEQQNVIRQVLAPYRPKLIAVFGSRARGEERADSDLDLLVDLQKEIDLLELIGIEQELSERLNIKVDIVMDRSVNPRLRPFIMQDLIEISAAA